MNGEYMISTPPKRVQVDIVTDATTSATASAYATRVDTVSTASVTYVGKALPGTATASASWQIQRIDESGTPETTVITWADGDASFDNVWNDRTSLSYS